MRYYPFVYRGYTIYFYFGEDIVYNTKDKIIILPRHHMKSKYKFKIINDIIYEYSEDTEAVQ